MDKDGKVLLLSWKSPSIGLHDVGQVTVICLIVLDTDSSLWLTLLLHKSRVCSSTQCTSVSKKRENDICSSIVSLEDFAILDVDLLNNQSLTQT